MSELEWQPITPEELIRELVEAARQGREDKYAFQVGLKDLDFEIDEDQAKALGVSLPFQSIDQAERALRERIISPTMFLEDDDTRHQVAVFDPEPVGLSGFMGCVTHSLALTDQGLFEVGRFPGMHLIGQSRSWQWFLHRHLATPDQVATWRKHYHLAMLQLVELCSEAMLGEYRHRSRQET
jgi:hypothetical protein